MSRFQRPQPDRTPKGDWSARFGGLARAAGIRPGERLVAALSGGADSVYLVSLMAEAHPRPDVVCVHVNHHLRGSESDADAEFCRQLTEHLGLPLVIVDAPVPSGPGLEERARQARYRALFEATRELGATAILTAHHADDALETLLWRWIRGSAVEGLGGASRELDPARGFGHPELDGVRLVRPLGHLRRAEVRAMLKARGQDWREDSSNADPAHTRARIRHGLLPEIERLFGEDAVTNLGAFGRAVQDLEDSLAERTAHLFWRRPRHQGFHRRPFARAGGTLERAPLMQLPVPLRRRVLRRLVTEGTGRSPGARLLAQLVDDLGMGRCTRHSLPSRWVLWMRSDQLVLVAPVSNEVALGKPSEGFRGRPKNVVKLEVPGIVELADGRQIVSSWREGSASAPPSDGTAVELAADSLPDELQVRLPVPGDRFHALGAPGSKRLVRYLAARGVPREERPDVPLVGTGDEILWVTGLDPCERHRVQDFGARRLRLELKP